MKLGLLALAFALLVSCKPVSTPDGGTVEAGVAVATGVCTLLEGVDDNGTLRTICVTIEELAPLIAFILTLRTADAGVTAACTPIKGTAFCATSAEISKAIVFLSKTRAARFAIDAGVR